MSNQSHSLSAAAVLPGAPALSGGGVLPPASSPTYSNPVASTPTGEDGGGSIPRVQPSPVYLARNECIIGLAQGGHSYNSIVDLLGVSRNTVAGVINRAKAKGLHFPSIPKHRRVKPRGRDKIIPRVAKKAGYRGKVDLARAKELRAQGVCYDAIAFEQGVSMSAVWKALNPEKRRAEYIRHRERILAYSRARYLARRKSAHA